MKIDIIDKGATFSGLRLYRYSLRRIWDRDKLPAMFIGLNPSTADEEDDDPTVRRCMRFACDWGYGGLLMANAFAVRATDPKEMLRHAYPVGPYNDDHLKRMSGKAGIVVAAWGVLGAHMGRDKKIMKMIQGMFHLGLTKGGHPKHPLYLRADTKPTRFNAPCFTFQKNSE